MADEEKTAEETPEATPEEAPAAEETAAPEAAEEQAPEAAADEAPAEEAPAEDAPAENAGPDEFEGMTWKAKQRILRSRESGAAGPQRSPEDRATERDAARKVAATNRSAYRKKERAAKGESGEGTPPAERESAASRERQGIVVSSKRDKTITVRMDVARRHPRYEKVVRRTNTLHAHDERNEAGEGDLVRVIETRPISRTKRWRLVEVMEKAK